MVNSLPLVQLWREPGLRKIPAHSTTGKKIHLGNRTGGGCKVPQPFSEWHVVRTKARIGE